MLNHMVKNQGMDTFKSYWDDLTVDARHDLADRCSTTYNQLRNVAYGKKCGESLAIAIDRETGGAVRCESLRPDAGFDYLRGTQKNPP